MNDVQTVKRSFLLAPSMLAADMSRLGDEIRKLEGAGVDLFHFDIMDGHFVPNLTIGFPVIESLRRHTKLPFDAHLMIENADRYLDDFARVGCNWLSVHVEACPHLDRTLTKIKDLGMRAGVAINPGTSLHTLDVVLDRVDYILVMSVNPGFGGQSFISDSLKRVKEFKKMLRADQLIQMDGGIKRQNIAEVVQAGVDVVVMGTGLLAAGDYLSEVRHLRSVVSS